jgi:hypothetical protein
MTIGADRRPVTFEADIRPLFESFRGAMKWRFDLTDYEHVRANAGLILQRIGIDGDMPPESAGGHLPTLEARFRAWVADGYQRG